MKIELTQVYDDELNPDDDMINDVLLSETVEDSVDVLINALIQFKNDFPNAVIDNEYPELTVRADKNGKTYFMMVTTKDETA